MWLRNSQLTKLRDLGKAVRKTGLYINKNFAFICIYGKNVVTLAVSICQPYLQRDADLRMMRNSPKKLALINSVFELQ